MNEYQAIYDAVRSRISNGNVGAAIESAIRDANVGHYFFLAGETIKSVAYSHENPSVLYRPNVYIDGDKWCALYGENLQDGVAGFGDSPQTAMSDFDKSWRQKLGEPS